MNKLIRTGLLFVALIIGGCAVSLDEIRPLAEQGNPEAQNYLGGLYEMGRGVPESKIDAARWYAKAADQGHEQGLENVIRIASSAVSGDGIEFSQDQLRNWLVQYINLIKAKAKSGDTAAKKRLKELRTSYAAQKNDGSADANLISDALSAN